MSAFRVEEKTAPSRIMEAALLSPSSPGAGCGRRRQQAVLEEEKEQQQSGGAGSSHSLSTSPCPSSSSSSPSPQSSASPSKSSVSSEPSEPSEGDALDSSSQQLRHMQLATAEEDAATASSASEPAVSQAAASSSPSTASTSANSSLASSGFSSPVTASSSSSFSAFAFATGDRGSDLLRPLFSGFESGWQQQQQQRSASLSLDLSSASHSSPALSSPGTARRQLQHGLAVGGQAQSQPPPASQSLRDPSQADVERAMGPALLAQYGLQLMPALTAAQPQSASLAQQACAETLRAEGCPFCLLHRDVDDGSPASLAPRYAALTCSLLQCRHVAHLHCLLLALQQPPPTSSLRLPALDSSHSTAACRLLAVPLPSATSARFHAAQPTEPLSHRRFTVELCLAHQCANTQQARVSWPTLVPAHVDGGEQQFLYLSFTSASDDGSASVESPRPSSSTASAPSSPALRSSPPPAALPSASLSSDALRFTALRGKLLFVCRDAATQDSCEHLVHYDITQQAVAAAASAAAASASSPASASSLLSLASSGRCLLKLVHAESGANRNVLTVGVHRARDGRGWAVAFVRYDFRPAAQPHLSSVQAYMHELAFPLQPSASSLLKQPVNGLPAFNPAAPAFVPSGLAALQTELDGDGYAAPLSLSQASSPFSKPRLPVSAPASSTASPVPSSRSIHYSAAVGSPSHLLGSSPSASPHFQRPEQPQPQQLQPLLFLEQQQQQQRLLKFAAQSRAGAAASSSMPSLAAIQQPQLAQHLSPQSFSRGLQQQQQQQQPRQFVAQGGRYTAAAAGGGGAGGGVGWDANDDADGAEDGRYGGEDDDGDFDSGGRERRVAEDSRFLGNLGIRREPLESNEQSPLFLPALPTFPVPQRRPAWLTVNLGP